MAKTTNNEETKAETQTASTTEPEQVNLPDNFDVAKAAGIVGAKRAQLFFDEVAFASVGNLSQHYQPSIHLKGLVVAAEDPENSQRRLAQETFEKVEKLFADAAKQQNNS